MNLISKIAFTAALVSAASAVTASEKLIFTEEAFGKSARALSVDLMNSGATTAFEAQLVLPKGAKGVDTAKCVASVPKTHTAQCVYRAADNTVHFMVYSLGDIALTKGIVPIGTVTFVGGAEKVQVKEFLAGGQRASQLKTSVISE